MGSFAGCEIVADSEESLRTSLPQWLGPALILLRSCVRARLKAKPASLNLPAGEFFSQLLLGSLQQSPAPAGSFEPASRTTFHFPSGSLRHMVI